MASAPSERSAPGPGGAEQTSASGSVPHAGDDRRASGLRVIACTPASALTLAIFLLFAGCFPHSCRRTESTELVPSDSLSREIAESVREDTLRLLWTATGPDLDPLEYPRTVRFGKGGTLYAGDVQRGSVFVFEDGRFAREITLSVDVPYLAGYGGDTLSIFSPASLGIYRIASGAQVDSILLVDPDRRETSLVYAAVRDRIYYKRVDPDLPGIVVTFTPAGEPIDSTHLEGPHWRYAGLLKIWGDTLLSLSGFRPVVDLLPAGRADDRPGRADVALGRTDIPTNPQSSDRPAPVRSSVADTLALVGFDSPMLARSHAFLVGDIHEPPLLSASAAAAGDLLFVMNMRPGWLQVDVFGRDGKLRRRLMPPDRTYRNAFLPHDIDVRRTKDGFEIAVTLSQPEPRVEVFAWNPVD